MRWRPSIFGWEVSCKSSRRFGIGRFRFFQILGLRLLSFFRILRQRFLSFLLTNLCIVALQLEYTKKQGTENLHFAAIFKVLAIILLLHTCWHKCLTDFLIIELHQDKVLKS
ncbi:hypothetical protein L3X38_016202 [Prunus dulcis]|uniref:Uncharacterized protein n=1 Tax=Prunus dulcis TaxID=3755 RepID=A0AAD4W4Y9_PRUDU|nr:hypothetical protein L3X38_016202 [Prunus dulcis]